MYPLLLLVSLTWAGSFIAIKIALNYLDPCNLAFYRFLIATPIMLILFRPNLKIRLKDLPSLIILGLSGVTLLYVVQFTALELTTATKASILINTSVIFTAILSHIFLREGMNVRKILGILIAFLGVFLVVSNGQINFTPNLGDLLMIFDGLLWAIYTVLGKAMLKSYRVEHLTTYAFALGTAMLFPFALSKGLANPFEMSLGAILSLLYLSILCSVFAYLAWYYALKALPATNVAVFTYLIPLFTALLAYVLLKEEITMFTALGGILIVLGVYFVERD
ncbi:DMT family transporter [Archaeoglobus profundus]|uniref:EamA domain-containing protein n=1 Tax=Archaeoglobus profundus (strain DSM 5631 / JCM 9629 / NBRC 100127 / Av18) TaxID=572546 RepID=D2RFI7_ARCPA|nr:DMT family transporter [Archaeoglobus profundus]ADB58881.1 protein of unknown function DUF6 transmembrane [Archaeoglobus profundus DSM 5631]